MKILFVLEYYYPHIGGVETFFKKLTEGLLKRGFQVTVVTSQIEKTAKHVQINGVEIRYLSLPKFGKRYWFTLVAPFYLLFLAPKYDLIHTTTYNAALPAWLIAFIFRKKIILTVHEVWGKLWFSLPEMNYFIALMHCFFERFILKLPFNYYIADSEYTQRSLLKIIQDSRKVRRIYLGIDYNLFDPVKYTSAEIRNKFNLSNRFIYTYFGRPGWIKGIPYLIRAVPEIRKKVPYSKLMLILSHEPSRPYANILKLIKELKIQENVLLIDSVAGSELPKYILASNCVVVPSLSEGFGFAAAEACAMKVPVVVTNVGSLPEVASGKVNFCQPGDSSLIAKGVVKIYQEDFQIVPTKRFIWSEVITEYMKVYNKLL